MNLTNNITSTSGSRDISMPIVHSILINPMIIQSIFKNIQWWSIYNIIIVVLVVDAIVIITITSILSPCITTTGWPQTWKTWNTQGFLWTWKTQGILRKFSATSGKNCNKQNIFSLSFKYLCKTAVGWVNRIIGTETRSECSGDLLYYWSWMWNDPWWRSLLHLLFVAITYGKVSTWLWKSLENSGNFFSYFVATLYYLYY